MAAIALGRATIGLVSDLSTQVVIPVLTAMTKTSNQDTAFVRFAGDKYPTAFHGEGQSMSLSLSCMYPRDDHDQLAAMLKLLRLTMPASADSRLFLRTHAASVVGLNDAFACEVDGDLAESWAFEAVTLTLPVRVVQFDPSV